MTKKEKELIFNQLITKINLGKFDWYEKEERIIFLSKGILIALSNEIIFYDFKRFSKTFLKSINEKDKKYIRISKLLDDKFCIYTLNETFIYQFNNEDFTIKLLKKINVNLVDLIEIENDKYINITEKFIYIWKQLKSIFHSNNISIIIIKVILHRFNQVLIPSNINIILYYIISLILFIIIGKFVRKYIYIINSYKRIAFKKLFQLEKCGTDLCCIKSSEKIMIFDYKNCKIIKELVSINERPFLWSFLLINNNLLILIDRMTQKMKVYDIIQNKIIKNCLSNDIEDIYHTFNVGDNNYITVQNKEIIRWKYNFESNEINIIDRINQEYLASQYLTVNILESKLFLAKKKYLGENFNTKIIYLYIYK